LNSTSGTYHNKTQINSKVLQHGFSIKPLMRGEHGKKLFCYKEATKCGKVSQVGTKDLWNAK
jgi:hypothetical protein